MKWLVAVSLAALVGIACDTVAPDANVAPGALPKSERRVSFEADVKPVLDHRCVVCHGCYDAPCQLLLSSPAGVARGASKEAVYATSRLREMAPTRLGIDAPVNFHPVLADDPAASLLFRMLALGTQSGFTAGERLPDSVPLDIDRELTCAEPDEFGAYASEHPHGGMPYGTAPLSSDDLGVLAAWLAQGAPLPERTPPGADADVKTWEAFLNGTSRKERLVARYLYEHWFVAHLAFDGRSAGPFYRVVRSRTAPDAPIDEIATRRPYDDPGKQFWYRLQRIDDTIVHKTHIVYTLGAGRLARLRQLFLSGDWEPTQLPSYDAEIGANPFVAYAAMPARSRSQFLLDDAQYFVMTFIRGPVCRGQVAVDVIEDHFWVAFLDPDRDPTITDPTFLRENAKLLDLPAEHAGEIRPGALALEYDVKQREYMKARARYYDRLDPDLRGPALDWVWDGDGQNRNALLTVFRNFDNATVVRGFQGEIPKTAWIMDYPIFERIYYDLVAGYDVFGSVGHQVATRLYMDDLRMQGENVFLGFLPADQREAIRASWYVGATHDVDYRLVNRSRASNHGTQVEFTSSDVKADLLEQLIARSSAVAGPPDLLNRCKRPPCRLGDVERTLARLASVKGAWVQHLPEVSFLRVRDTRDRLYSLVHHAAHTNVAMMFEEEKRRLPADDTLSVIRGHFGGSYPNFFFEVPAADVGAFVDALLAVASAADLERFAARYGIRRTDPRFWETADWLHDDLRRSSPTEFGLYDLNRYANL